MKATLDACVLYPTVMREVLLGAANAGFYQPFWSPRILGEWGHAAARDGEAYAASARVDIALVTDAFPNAHVSPDETKLSATLPDPDDDHVLAAAIAAKADLIVTLNHKDFPQRILRSHGIGRSDPDALLAAFANENAARMQAVVNKVVAKAEQASGIPQTAPKLLKKAGLKRLAKQIRPD